MGCDIQGIHVIKDQIFGLKNIFKFEDNSWSLRLVGAELIIKTAEEEFSFLGKDMWKVNQQY